jgi:hypothetical protein
MTEEHEIQIINTYAAKWTIAGWFIGLAYYNWLAPALLARADEVIE